MVKETHDWIEVLTALLEAKNSYTRGHSVRVGHLADALAQVLALGAEETKCIHLAGHLHDIGKIGVPDAVLLKTGKLTLEEWESVKQHPVIGGEILAKTAALASLAPLVRHHHERWDGEGYPDRLSGHDIPLGSRIIAVADSFDAMVSARPYRNALVLEWALGEIRKQSGRQFDPLVAEAFLFLAKRTPEKLLPEPSWENMLGVKDRR